MPRRFAIALFTVLVLLLAGLVVGRHLVPRAPSPRPVRTPVPPTPVPATAVPPTPTTPPTTDDGDAGSLEDDVGVDDTQAIRDLGIGAVGGKRQVPAQADHIRLARDAQRHVMDGEQVGDQP